MRLNIKEKREGDTSHRIQAMMRLLSPLLSLLAVLSSCSASGNGASQNDTTHSEEATESRVSVPDFSADSAYAYVRKQVEFGPRVPNSESHRLAGEWLANELRRHGAEVILQKATLTAFDGTALKAVNIFGQYNPEAGERLLLLAHYDCRPWADNDSDPSAHGKPVDGANDGASGVGVLLETARQLHAVNPGLGIDILFVDAEDYGRDQDEESWALGTRHFAQNPIKSGYRPTRAILLDMVGGKGASFPAEYFSRQAAPELDDAFRMAAASAGYGELFPRSYGSGVTDDHVELIRAGIPAIDIIDYRPDRGFPSTWHTLQDNIENIDPATLKAVGQSLLQYIYTYK